MKFISFYTKDGKYPELAKRLKASLERFNLDYDIEEMEPFQSWAEGCKYKSKFIYKKLMQHKQPVVWLDVDSEVWQFPELLFENNDFAIYNWLADKDHHLQGAIPHDPRSKTLLCSGGTQKWNYTIPMVDLLNLWIDKLSKEGNWEAGDDPVLDMAFNELNPKIIPLWLPKTYMRMDKNHTHHWMDIPKDQVVINHDYTNGAHRNT